MIVKPKNFCRACGRDFRNLTIFEAHRIGSFHDDTRRCVSDLGIQARGWQQDDKGRWFDPVAVEKVKAAFGKA